MFKNLTYSLADMLGKEYLESVINANCFFNEDARAELEEYAYGKVEFYPEAAQVKNDTLLKKVGSQVVPNYVNDNEGASTDSYKHALNKNAAPLTGHGCYRIGEDGKLYFVGKSEHYHASLGHTFGGYKLIDNARKLGILNATHNNTRGFITRTLERELVRTANGIAKEDTEKLEEVLNSREKHVLNRVINLETGSLAVEAGIKMMLHRFYELGNADDQSVYAGRIPVFFIMADKADGKEANYHGTTIFAQTMRGMWPAFYEKAEKNELYKVVSVKINDIEDFKNKMEMYNQAPFKTAGFMHEIVLMNYGGTCLHKEYLQKAHELCKAYDTPIMVDEIQSCIWYEELFLFRKYELEPDFVIIGKGFSGGEYPASKIITTAQMDTLNQFGALVTNGQEELASLSYLITMQFVQENGALIEENEKKFFDRLTAVAKKHVNIVKCAEGLGYLAALVFYDLDTAKVFAKKINQKYIDVSAQTYKLNCPAAVLIKPPMITTEAGIDFMIQAFDEILESM